MKKRQGSKSILAIRLAAESCVTALSRNVLEEIVGCSRANPLHWIFPARLLTEAQNGSGTSLLTRLEERRRTHGDQWIPAGYAGASHGFLHEEELEHEILWALSNPWGTGIGDAASPVPGFFWIDGYDDARESSRRFYDRTGLDFLFPGRAGDRVLLLQKGNFSALPMIRISGSGSLKSLKQPVPEAFRDSARFIFFDAENERGLLALPRLLDEVCGTLAERRAVFTSLSDSSFLPLGGKDETGVGAVPPLVDPANRSLLAYAASQRPAKKAKLDDIRRILPYFNLDRDLPGPTIASPSAPDPSEARERVLVSDMQGSVRLSDKRLDVLFERGRLYGLSSEERSPAGFFPKPVSSGFRIGGRDYAYRTENAFSFEGEEVHGLREISVFDADFVRKPGRMRIDYFFLENLPHLFVEIGIRHPWMDPETIIEAWAPFEWPVLILDETAPPTLEIAYNPKESVRFTRWMDSGVFFGLSFFLGLPERFGLELSFPSLLEPGIHTLPYRIRRERRKDPVLCLSPGGVYRPFSAARLNGLSEHFTFMIRLDTELEARIPRMLEKTRQELHPDWFFREDS